MENNLAREEVKKRYDNQGSEFGFIHRDLGQGYYMFDIDGIKASIEYDLTLRRENELFVEYRHLSKDKIKFLAIYEVKAKETKYSKNCLELNNSTSIVRLEIAKRLESRLFVVFGTNGNQPFKFFEIDVNSGDNNFIGILSYDKDNPKKREQTVKSFWANILGITK